MGLIKVWISNVETLWVQPVGTNMARLRNIPHQAPYHANDLVRLDGDKVVERIEQCTRTVAVKYPPDDYQAVRQHVVKHDVEIEVVDRGFVLLGIPLSMNRKAFKAMLRECPVRCKFTYLW